MQSSSHLHRLVCSGWALSALALLCLQTLAIADQPKVNVAPEWKSLFDGKQLGGWQIVTKEDFAKAGKVAVKDGSLILGEGKPATGVRLPGKFPRVNYEIVFEGQRVDGDDFFCGLSFPVGKESLTLILGGWGGWVVGLSCIDDRYAINNDTARGIEFKNGQWYRVRLRVAAGTVLVWVDGAQIIELKTEGYKLSVSDEMKPCLPLGIATWKTTGAIRNLRYRLLPETLSQP